MPRRAVVLGASMGGLLAARALSRHFDTITIVDRDTLPEDEEVRKGVPQAAHAHGLLASGYRVMDQYFPGLMDELEARGAPRGDGEPPAWHRLGRARQGARMREQSAAAPRAMIGTLCRQVRAVALRPTDS